MYFKDYDIREFWLYSQQRNKSMYLKRTFLCRRINGIEILDDNAICNILPDCRVNRHLHLLSRVLTRRSIVHIVNKNNI